MSEKAAENGSVAETAGTFKDTAFFVHDFIKNDLNGETYKIKTRFPPEPNGYLHIGHARNIFLNYGLAKYYGGTFNLRFDDTNPAKESSEFVQSIQDDIKWLGCDWEDRLFFASDYFEQFYAYAVLLIKKGKAFVCDLSADEIRDYRGTLNNPGKESPYRNRTAEENLYLFERMKNGDYPDGTRTLRAKIDMASPNINMRDPVLYRIAHIHHHNTGNKWCIYPMYDYAHPLEDAIEKITHSICTLEFEDHRPFYDWVVNEVGFDVKPRQIEVAKLLISDTVAGKRYIRALVESGEVDGWDDPRLITLSAMRRRGYTKDALLSFCEKSGVSKAASKTDYSFLEYCLREDLKAKSKTVMAVLDPVKVVITNYPENETEYLEIENNPENPELGRRKVLFSREIFIEKSDFMEDAPSKFYRLTPGKEVRLYGAYFIMCEEAIKDNSGNIIEIRCTYDKETKSGTGFTGRKVKGTIHWVSCQTAVKATVRHFDVLVFDNAEAEEGFIRNDSSITIFENCLIEESIKSATLDDKFQFMRTGYYCIDSKYSKPEALVFNQTVALKSAYK